LGVCKSQRTRSEQEGAWGRHQQTERPPPGDVNHDFREERRMADKEGRKKHEDSIAQRTRTGTVEKKVRLVKPASSWRPNELGARRRTKKKKKHGQKQEKAYEI